MTNIWHKPILIIFICLAASSAYSQQPLRFDRLGRNEGLSQSSVNCMLRDRDGFMWFGTQDGLNLYDGKKFRVFQNRPGDTTSLSNNYIVSICEDDEGFLWIGTMTGGLNRFDKRTERFTTFIHSDTLNSISENTVWTVLSDGQGHIWAGTSYGVNRYDKNSGQFKVFRPIEGDSTSLATDLTVSLYKDRQGNLWVGTVEGLCLFDTENESFIRYYNPMEKELKGANIIWSVSQTPSGEIITGTDNGVYLLNPSYKHYLRILGAPGEPQLVAWSVTVQDDRWVWTGSDRGLIRMDLEDFSKMIYLNDPVNPNSLTNNNVWCLLPDPAGFLWAGTNNGISKTKSTASKVNLLSSDPWQPAKLSSSKIMAVMEDKYGYLWVGTDGGGLNRVSPDKKSCIVFNSSNSGLTNDNVWALAEDNDGNIYIGNYQGGLHRYDRVSGTIFAYPLNAGDPYSLSNRRVLALLVDREGKVWIGTRGGGLCRLDPSTKRFQAFTNAKEDMSGFPSLTVLSLAMDTDGRLWAGTHEGGLALYNQPSGTFSVFKHVNGDPNSLSENNVWSIAFDSKGRLWAGTQGGLNFADGPGEQMKFNYLTVDEGLRSNIILGIQEDSQGNIWLSSFSGIARLDINAFETFHNSPETNESSFLFNPLFTLFDPDHGLQGLEFNQGASHKGHDGTLYFGGSNGLNYFTDKEVKASDYLPAIVITDFKVFSKDVLVVTDKGTDVNQPGKIEQEGKNYYLKEKISFLGELILTYRESVFSFEFSSLDYTNPNKNKYAYKMIGFDENWNYMGTQNTATYTNLDPGEYTLVVRGSNSDGIWNPAEKKMKITIIPPFWMTGWFKTISVFLIILVIYLLIRSYFLNQQRKTKREKELIELQLKTIKSQIDPHFAFNAINTIASFMYSDKPDVAYDYFTRFARMIRNILEDNEKISRTVNEELDFVRNYLELQKMRFREKLEYFISIGEDVPLNAEVPKMIIQSYAENAIKHGLMHRKSGGALSITLSMNEPVLIIEIEDNGIGREKAAQLSTDSTHRGFRIMERTIELYSKLNNTRINQVIEDLRDEKGNPLGTRVVISLYLPVKKTQIHE